MSKKFTIEEIQEMVKGRGKCTSKIYIGIEKPLHWECNCGYQFDESLKNVRRNKWCKVCTKITRYTIEDLKYIAGKNNLECLAKEYLGNHKPHLWKCLECNHQWKASPSSIINIKSGCPKCAGNIKRTLEDVREVAKRKQIKCLSEVYVNNRSELQWECLVCNYQWRASAGSIINADSGCPACAGNIIKTMEDMHILAASRGWKCLSKEYKNSQTPLDWECADGHQFPARPANVNYGYGCPDCNLYIGEEICRAIFQQLFNHNFVKVRPSWLERLELDGYCDDISLAFEYQGLQHSNPEHHFHKVGKGFEPQVQRDVRKLEICKERGIIVIQVPQFENTFDGNAVKAFIKEQVILNGGQHLISVDFDEIKLDISKLKQKARTSQSQLAILNKIAESRSGKCLSLVYMGNVVNHTFKCHNINHPQFPATPHNVKKKPKGTWCPYCAGKKIVPEIVRATVQFNKQLSIPGLNI